MDVRQSGHKNITLSDIAESLNVSVSTVSRALNGNKEVSANTSRKVMDAVRRLNYVPNEIARGLVTQTSKTLAALIPDILNPYYAELLKVIETEVSKNGFTLLLCITDESDDQIEYYIKEMMKRRVGGILLLSTVVKNAALFEQLKSSMVVVDIGTDTEGVDRICHNNKRATYEMIRYLIGQGHRDIGFIGYKFDEMVSLSKRLEGYKKALDEAGIAFRSEYVSNADSINNPGYYSAQKLLSLPKPPTAIHCMNEYVAMGAFIAISDMGLKIPDDISLTAYDDLAISQLMRPRLTTVHIPIPAIGEAAVEMLLQGMLSGPKKDKRTLTFDSELMIRDSVAPPKSR